MGAFRGRRQYLPDTLCQGRDPPGNCRPIGGRREIHELPTARGCTYVVPATDFAWGLQVGRGAAEAEVKVLGRLGIERDEDRTVGRVGAGNPAAVQRQPHNNRWTLASLRKSWAESPQHGRSGQEEGLKHDAARRFGIVAGRRAHPPCAGQRAVGPATLLVCGVGVAGNRPATKQCGHVVERFLGWTGGATLGQVRWFTAFTVAQSKKALAGIGAVGMKTAGDDVLWMMPEDVSLMATFEVPTDEDVQLLAGSDSLVLLRRNSSDLFDEKGKASVQGMTGSALAADLSDHPIVDRGRIIGLWQYDRRTGASRGGPSSLRARLCWNRLPRLRRGSARIWVTSGRLAWIRRSRA